jgi:hypothetical protein
MLEGYVGVWKMNTNDEKEGERSRRQGEEEGGETER